MSAPKHAKETLNFTGFSGYYGAMSGHDGYGGFNYLGLMEYMNTSLFSHEPWCNQGYVNVAAATGASALGWIYFDGVMESASPTESFSLKSFVAASAWSTDQKFRINTYTYASGSFTLKGTMYAYLSQTATTVKLGKLGKNIAAVSFYLLDLGSPGNTCTYGSGTYGYQMAWGDVKVKWNGKIPTHSTGIHAQLPGFHNHHQTAHTVAQLAHNTSHVNGSHQGSAHHNTDTGYHSQLLALHHESGNLASQFNLPQVEHSL